VVGSGEVERGRCSGGWTDWDGLVRSNSAAQ